MTSLPAVESQERPEMVESPRLFDDLGLVALPTAVSCARMFTQYTLDKWGGSLFLQSDALVVVGELVKLSVAETGITDDDVNWSELDYINRIVVRLLGFERSIVIEVWDAADSPAVLPDDEAGMLPSGLQLVDVTARRWASNAGPQGRLTWAELAVYQHTDSGLPIRRRGRRSSVEPAELVDESLIRRVRDGLRNL